MTSTSRMFLELGKGVNHAQIANRSREFGDSHMRSHYVYGKCAYADALYVPCDDNRKSDFMLNFLVLKGCLKKLPTLYVDKRRIAISI